MLSSTDLVQAVTADLEKIRETAPLVLSLTNSVVQPLTANLLLAIGAVPAMLNDAEEAVDMLRSGTGALLVNLGTVTREQGAAMQTAVREANRLNIPWVLDPVAVGALSLRTRLAGQLKEQSPRIIRGNASEIMALAGYSSVTKGPESTSSSADALHAARELALHTGAAVLVTGRTDYYTDDRVVEFKYYRSKDADRMLALTEPLAEHVEQVKGYAEDTKKKFPNYNVRSYVVYICANKGWKCWEV